MDVVEKKCFLDIKDTHNRLFLQNRQSSIFQSFEIIRCVNTLPYYLKCKSGIKIYEVKECNNTVLIALFRKLGSKLSVVGSEERFDFVDFIYGDIDTQTLYNALVSLFLFLKEEIGIKEIEIKYLDVESKTYNVINDISSKQKEIKISFSNVLNENLDISFRDYDQYLSSLSKNTRQNIRTAYNRLKKDNYEHELKMVSFKYEHDEFIKIHKMCLNLYKKRLKKQYNCGVLALIMKKYDYVSKGIMNDLGYISALNFNGRIVAFMEGFIDKKNKSILIPRLAIDEQFKFYSPGIVLLNETIKQMYSNKEYNFLNLLRGNEKYKIAMGCKEYLTSNVTIRFI